MGNLIFRVGAFTIPFLLYATLSNAQLTSEVKPSPSLESGSSLSTFNEPDAFLGIPWEASKDIVYHHRDVRFRDSDCKGDIEITALQHCEAWVTLGNKTLSATIRFRDDRFVSVIIRFAEKDYDFIHVVFRKAYGSPTRSTLENNRRLSIWNGHRVLIKLLEPFKGAVIEKGSIAGSAMLALKTELEREPLERAQVQHEWQQQELKSIEDAAKALVGATGDAAGDERQERAHIPEYSSSSSSEPPQSSRNEDVTRSSTPSSGGTFIRGPRGGCYRYSKSGRKVYVDRSLCN